MSAGKLKLLDRLQRFVVNPLVKRALLLGVPDPGDALLETHRLADGPATAHTGVRLPRGRHVLGVFRARP